MLIKVLVESTKDNNFFNRIKNYFLLLKYFLKLQSGIRTQKIYHLKEKQDESLNELIKNLNQDTIQIINELLRNDVKKFLETKNLKSHLDLDKKESSLQIGFNTLYVEKPITGLWTTGKGIFYIPTKKGVSNRISIKLRSIAPLEVTIGFENLEIKKVKMPQLSTKEISFEISPNQIKNNVSEIFVSTDKLWFPNFILSHNQKITIGVGVQTITVS